MPWRACLRILANLAPSWIVAIVIENIYYLRLVLHPTDVEKAAGLNTLMIGDPYTAHPAFAVHILFFAALILRDIASGINR